MGADDKRSSRAASSSSSSPQPLVLGLSLIKMLFVTATFAFACLCYYATASAANFGVLARPSHAFRGESDQQNLLVLPRAVEEATTTTAEDASGDNNRDDEPTLPEEIAVQSSKEELPMKADFYTSDFDAQDTSTTIIFNVFKGEPRALEMQLEAAASQQNLTSPPEVWVMCFNSPRQSEFQAVVERFRSQGTLPNLVFTVSNFNHKFHGRFLLAYMAKTKYVLLVDDDKMIDETTVIDYIAYIKQRPGVWGNSGHLRASTFEGYKSWPSHGYDTRVQDFAEQDYLCGMWFLEQSWLEYFAKERPPTWETSEDMHLSHVMRKYLNLNTYGGKVALNTPKLPSKKHAATVGSALDLREHVFDHQLGRGNKVANVVAPLRTLVYAETVEDIQDFVAKVQSCPAMKDSGDGQNQNQLRTGNTKDGEATANPEVPPPPWCSAGRTAVVFRGAAEQDVQQMIKAAEELCSLTDCEYLSVKPKIQHPIRYFNMREGYGQSIVDIAWQAAASDVLLSLVGVLNNVLPEQFFFPDVENVEWKEPETTRKRNRLQIYHSTVGLALRIHASTKTNQKWDNRDLETDLETAFPTNMRVFTWRKPPSTVATKTAEEREAEDAPQSLFQELSFE